MLWIKKFENGSILFQVNIIPIIAKADTINKSELQKFKTKIMSELINNGVQVENIKVHYFNSKFNSAIFIQIILKSGLIRIQFQI